MDAPRDGLAAVVLAAVQTDGGAGATSRLSYGTVSIGDPSPSTAAVVQLVNNYSNSYYGSVETMQVARNLTVTRGSNLDLNGYQMTVALGTATVNGTVNDGYGAGRTSTLLLAENAGLTVDGGTVAVDQLTLNSGSNLTLAGDQVFLNYTAIPEPVSGLLLALGAVLAGLRRRW